MQSNQSGQRTGRSCGGGRLLRTSNGRCASLSSRIQKSQRPTVVDWSTTFRPSTRLLLLLYNLPECYRKFISMMGIKKIKDHITVVVLKQIEKNRALWDSTCPEHHFLDLRNDAWASVALAAGLPVAQCKLIWKNVRGAHLTHARRGLSDFNENRKPFLYHEELTFWLKNDENTQPILSTHENVKKREPLKTLMSSTPQSLSTIRSDLEKIEREKDLEKKPLSPIPEEKSYSNQVNSSFLLDKKTKLPSVENTKQALCSEEVWRAKQKKTTLKRKADAADSLALMIKFMEAMNDPENGKAVCFGRPSSSESTDANINNSKIELNESIDNDDHSIEKIHQNSSNSMKDYGYDLSTDKDDISTIKVIKKEIVWNGCLLKLPNYELLAVFQDYVNNILKNDDDTVIISAHSITLRRRDLATLMCGNKWLNDQVINFYLQLIQNRGQREGYPSVKVLSTFLFPALQAKESSLCNEWDRNMPDLFNFKYCLIPIHYNDHWSLIIIHVNMRIIEYFDSLRIGNKACFQIVTDFIRKTTKQEIWICHCIEDRPIQENGYDCGMFVLAYAEQFTRPVKPIRISEDDINQLRVQVAYEIATGGLLH
ncbi:Sentrin-specific protease 2 [Frankliniella fusca]|uniref:Sentrin-specific protease 2 n=1 Tax=Frankliniella fusca TaxID=407009 RepID=A0AAE1LL98_9NEOP|nr:Sentrin-specific protease 2 [Frankliniella fusca]